MEDLELTLISQVLLAKIVVLLIENVLLNVADFHVREFSSLYSDAHRPICT